MNTVSIRVAFLPIHERKNRNGSQWHSPNQSLYRRHRYNGSANNFRNQGCIVIYSWKFGGSRQFRELSSSSGRREDAVKWQGDISAWRSRKISKSTLLALMSRDADRLLAYGEMPARCVAKVGCRVADSEYVPEYVANRSMIDVLRSTRHPNFPIFQSSRERESSRKSSRFLLSNEKMQ